MKSLKAWAISAKFYEFKDVKNNVERKLGYKKVILIHFHCQLFYLHRQIASKQYFSMIVLTVKTKQQEQFNKKNICKYN